MGLGGFRSLGLISNRDSLTCRVEASGLRVQGLVLRVLSCWLQGFMFFFFLGGGGGGWFEA